MIPSYTPMAPALVRAPFHRPGWVYEEKVDGWRMLAYKDGERVSLVSRHGRDHTRRFADLAAAIGRRGRMLHSPPGGVRRASTTHRTATVRERARV